MKPCNVVGMCAVLLCLALSTAAPVAAQPNPDVNLIVFLRGVGDEMAEPPIDGALCYEAELVLARSQRVVGTGIDCLENITTVGDGIALDRTTFFSFPQGELVAAGPTTVAPVTTGSPGFTHVVGDVPEAGTNSIVSGTGVFREATGTVRLSGIVDLTEFPATVTFNCLFVIDFDDQEPPS